MSPKVWVPAVLQVLAGVVLYIITHNPETLIATLTGISTAVLGFKAPVLADDGQGSVTMQQVKDARNHHAGGKLPAKRRHQG